MRREQVLGLLAIGGAVLMGCPGEPDEEMILGLSNVEGGNPIVPEVGMLPFPSSLYEDVSDSSLTGRRLDFEGAPLPDGVDAGHFSGMDGYSRFPQITTQLDVPFDSSNLPTDQDPEISLSPDSPVVLLNLDTGEPTPILAEPDRSVAEPDGRLLLIRPLQALAANTHYGVIVTSALMGEDGAALEVNDAVRALRDGIPTDSSPLESQREEFNELMGVAGEFGLSSSQVIQGWTFHTRSEEQLSGPLLAMHDRMNSYELGDVTWTSDTNDGINRMIRGEFEAPNFLNADGELVRDENGLPIEQGFAVIPFLVTVPATVTDDRPFIVYGHGFFSHMNETLWSSLNYSLHEWNMSAVSMNFIGFSEDDYIQAAQGLGGDVMTLSRIADQQLQSQANFTALGRLSRDVLSSSVLTDGGEPILNAETMNYMGISNGGTQGAVITAFSPIFDRAALIVGGGGWAHMMQRASQWTTLGALLQNRYPDPAELQLSLSLFQHILDPVDAVNYVEHLTKDRYPGRDQAVRVTFHEAVGDAQVSNVSTEWVARTAGVPLLTPTPREVWGLDTVEGSSASAEALSGALFIYDEGYPELPEGNVAPEENGAHESIRSLDSYHAQVGAFLESGVIAQTCDGPCDPN